jgi:hypothetical protein
MRAPSLLWAATVLVVSACADSERPKGSPGGPTAPDDGLHSLSGTIFEHSAQGQVPLESFIFFDYVRPGDSFSTGGSANASDGRYLFEHIPSGTSIRLRAHVLHVGWRSQPCAAQAVVRSDLVLDIEVVRPGAAGVTSGSPTVTGVVYHTTPGGRVPIPDADVSFTQGCRGLRTPYTRTDSEGRYAFCRVPAGGGCVVAGVERYGGQWFSERQVTVSVSGDVVRDIELVAGEPPEPQSGLARLPLVRRGG